MESSYVWKVFPIMIKRSTLVWNTDEWKVPMCRSLPTEEEAEEAEPKVEPELMPTRAAQEGALGVTRTALLSSGSEEATSTLSRFILTRRLPKNSRRLQSGTFSVGSDWINVNNSHNEH